MTEQTHHATLSPAEEVFVASLGGVEIARSGKAVILQEVSPRKTYLPVIYFPLEDVDPACLTPSEHTSFCPIKGEAGYYAVSAAGELRENAAWFYAEPLPMVAGIKGHLAFYRDKVEVGPA